MKERYAQTQRSIETLAGGKTSRRSVLKWAAGAAGALVITPLLAACGGSDNASTATTASGGSSSSGGATPTAGGSGGSAAASPTKAAASSGSSGAPKVLTIVVGLDPGVLDPHGTNAAVSEATSVFGQIFETLLDVDYGTDLKPSFEPQLATAWKNVDDLTWEFTLREGVKFHNGDPFSADDVKFSVERILDPAMKSPATQYLPPAGVWDRVEVVDPKTVRFITKKPFPLMLVNVSRIRIVPMKYVQAQGKDGFGQKPIGTGPFKYVEWVKDDHTTLEKNTSYWGDAAQLDRVIFKPKPEGSTRTAELKAGTADIISLVPIADVKSIDDSKELSIASVSSNRSMFVELDSMDDTLSAPLKDVRVRQALNYAVDKDELITAILGGRGEKLNGQPVPKQFFGYSDTAQAYPYDPNKAKQLLAEAGFPNGFELTFRGPVGRYLADKEMTEAIAGQLAKVGIKTTLDIREWSAYIADLYKRPGLSPMFFLGWGPIPDAMGMFTLWLSDSVVKYHSNAQYDQMVNQAAQTVDQNQRNTMYQQIIQWLHDNPPAIYLYVQPAIYGVNDKVQGFKPSPDEVIRLKGVTKA